MSRTTLGRRIRRARLQNNWTQAFLAEKLGVTGATISNWEKRKTSPDEKQLRQLERRLGPLDGSSSKAAASSSEPTTEGPSPFGVWLSKARVESDMSVAELSEASGVSIPAIYSIESGRIENPRPETVRKVEKALGKVTPDELKQEMEEEAEIEGLGAFTDFDPHDASNLPNAPGVYVFYDISERPIYVGTAGDIGRRIRQHEEKFWFKQPIVETGSYIEIKDDVLRRQIETLLIKFLKSNAVLNKQNVER